MEYHPPCTSTKVSWATSPGVHLCHLLVEEVGQVLFVDICGGTASVWPTQLAREDGWDLDHAGVRLT